MELLYLWIENDRKTIKDQSFNFSNHMKFTFSEGKKLELTENDNYIEDLFGNSPALLKAENQIKEFNGRIVNITGIIGENGVGKTNLLNFIVNLFSDRLPINERLIIAVKNTERGIIEIIHTLEGIELEVIGKIPNYNIEVTYTHRNDDVEYYRPDYLQGNIFGNTELIYYNPIFDLRDFAPNISNDNRGYIDISTNALIQNDLLEEDHRYPDSLKEVLLYKYTNTRRQLDMLVNSQLANLKSINFPEEIDIIFHRNPFNPKEGPRNITPDNEAIFHDLDKYISDAWSEVNAALRKLSSDGLRDRYEYKEAAKEKLKIEFTYSFINNYFLNLSKHYNESIGVSIKDIKGGTLFERTLDFFNKQKLRGSEDFDQVDASSFYNLVLKSIDLMDQYKNPIEKDSNRFTINVGIGIEIVSAYESYLRSLPHGFLKETFITMNWRDLSSGESSLIDLYSRLFFAKNYKMDSIPPFIYLLIDEGEAGFHPQWQREYLYNLIDFVHHLFAESKVQIILTSHSPFIVSDLPKENLIFLAKNDSKCQVVPFGEEQTFAANIHALLTDQFFMKEGVIGKFAQQTLIEELKPLLDENVKVFNQDRLSKIISLIGEPIIKAKLNKMLHAKLNK